MYVYIICMYVYMYVCVCVCDRSVGSTYDAITQSPLVIMPLLPKSKSARYLLYAFSEVTGARCSSLVRASVYGAMGRWVDPSLSYFSFQPRLV